MSERKRTNQWVRKSTRRSSIDRMEVEEKPKFMFGVSGWVSEEDGDDGISEPEVEEEGILIDSTSDDQIQTCNHLFENCSICDVYFGVSNYHARLKQRFRQDMLEPIPSSDPSFPFPYLSKVIFFLFFFFRKKKQRNFFLIDQKFWTFSHALSFLHTHTHRELSCVKRKRILPWNNIPLLLRLWGYL